MALAQVQAARAHPDLPPGRPGGSTPIFAEAARRPAPALRRGGLCTASARSGRGQSGFPSLLSCGRRPLAVAEANWRGREYGQSDRCAVARARLGWRTWIRLQRPYARRTIMTMRLEMQQVSWGIQHYAEPWVVVSVPAAGLLALGRSGGARWSAPGVPVGSERVACRVLVASGRTRPRGPGPVACVSPRRTICTTGSPAR